MDNYDCRSYYLSDTNMSSLGPSHVSPAGNTFYPAPQGYWDTSTNEYMRLQGFYPCPLYARSSNMPAHGYDQQYTPPIGAWQPHMGMSAQLPQVNDSNAQHHYPAQYRLLVGK